MMARMPKLRWTPFRKPTKRLLQSMPCLMLAYCVTYNQGAGCVTYDHYRPTVSVTDTKETIREFDKLDLAMDAACGINP